MARPHRLALHPPRALSVKYDAKWKATFPTAWRRSPASRWSRRRPSVTTDGKRPLGAFSKYKRKLDKAILKKMRERDPEAKPLPRGPCMVCGARRGAS